MDVPKPAGPGTWATSAIDLTPRKVATPHRVPPSPPAGHTRADTHDTPDQNRLTDDLRQSAELRREMERRALMPGPPPAFELNLLELDGQLKELIARIEATRAQARDAGALAPVLPPDGAQEPAVPERTPEPAPELSAQSNDG